MSEKSRKPAKGSDEPNLELPSLSLGLGRKKKSAKERPPAPSADAEDATDPAQTDVDDESTLATKRAQTTESVPDPAAPEPSASQSTTADTTTFSPPSAATPSAAKPATPDATQSAPTPLPPAPLDEQACEPASPDATFDTSAVVEPPARSVKQTDTPGTTEQTSVLPVVEEPTVAAPVAEEPTMAAPPVTEPPPSMNPPGESPSAATAPPPTQPSASRVMSARDNISRKTRARARTEAAENSTAEPQVGGATGGSKLPRVPGYVAAVVTGILMGLSGVVLAWVSAQGCEAVRGVGSCGGFGLFALIVILGIEVLLGAALLKAWRVVDPVSTSFLGVGLVAVIVMLFFLDSIESRWMLLVIPVLTALTYLGSWWVTETLIENDQAPLEAADD